MNPPTLPMNLTNLTGNMEMEKIMTSPPKRPMTAFNYFFKEQRVLILDSLPEAPRRAGSRAKHGKIGFADLAKTVSARWKALDMDGRAPYIALSDQDRTRYSREKLAYQSYVKSTTSAANTAMEEPKKELPVTVSPTLCHAPHFVDQQDQNPPEMPLLWNQSDAPTMTLGSALLMNAKASCKQYAALPQLSFAMAPPRYPSCSSSPGTADLARALGQDGVELLIAAFLD